MTNIPKALKITISALLFFAFTPFIRAQQPDTLQKKLIILTKTKDYFQSIQNDSGKKMINIKKKIPDIVLDLRYATENNFMHRLMYPAGTSTTYFRARAAEALLKVQEELHSKGLGLKIWDAYRPYSVTEKFWELVHDDRYVANPKTGSGHNRGIAVDLTIINLKSGKELNMGTGFDNFSDSAHHDFVNLPPEVLENRNYLRSTMEKNGFRKFDTEWWHYSFGNSEDYEVLDFSFDQLKKFSTK